MTIKLQTRPLNKTQFLNVILYLTSIMLLIQNYSKQKQQLVSLLKLLCSACVISNFVELANIY